VKPFEINTIGRPEQWLIESAEAVGLDINGLSHEVTNYFVSNNSHTDISTIKVVVGAGGNPGGETE
jgi:hypothetical protein